MRSLQDILISFKGLLGRLPVIVVSLALVYFLYKLAVGMMTNNEKTRTETRNMMVYGIVTIFVMMFMWGIVKTVQNIFFPGAFIQQLGK